MDETAKARDLEEQIARARQQDEESYEPVEGWRNPSGTSSGLTQYELGMLYSQMAGHRWHAWRLLNGEEDHYFAACSCGWRSFEAHSLGLVLGDTRDHLDGVRVSHGYRRAASAAQVPDRGERESDAGQHEMRPGERAAELHASMERQQERLARTTEHFEEELAANREQADRRVAVLEREAERVAQERKETPASAQRAEALQRQLERARELRNGIASAAAAAAVAAEEITWIHQDMKTRHPGTAREESAGTARQAARPRGG